MKKLNNRIQIAILMVVLFVSAVYSQTEKQTDSLVVKPIVVTDSVISVKKIDTAIVKDSSLTVISPKDSSEVIIKKDSSVIIPVKNSTVFDSTVTDSGKLNLIDSTISKMFISTDSLKNIIPIDSALGLIDSANGDNFYYYTGTSPKCPSDMVLVEDSVFSFSFLGKKFFKTKVSVCVDRFEFPNIKDRYPITDITRFQAEKMCDNRGKRLCSDLEWVSSCKNGKKYTMYPYGNKSDIYKCNTHDRSVKRTGSYKDCHTNNGIFDMVGNVAEWTSGGGVGMYGGSFETQTKANCEFWTSKKFKYKSKSVGFRCCKSPSKN